MKRTALWLCLGFLPIFWGCTSNSTIPPAATATLTLTRTPPRTLTPTPTHSQTPLPTPTPTPTPLGGGSGELALTGEDRKIHIVHVDGTILREIANEEIAPYISVVGFSPDGRQLLVSLAPIQGRGLYGNPDIYAFTRESSMFSKLIENAYLYEIGKYWPRGASEVLYSCNVAGVHGGCVIYWDEKGGLRYGNFAPDSENVVGSPSPDKKFILSVDREQSTLSLADATATDSAVIFSCPIATTGMAAGQPMGLSQYFWSPDSSRVFVDCNFPDENGMESKVSYIVDIRDPSFIKLPESIFFPTNCNAWSPDSQSLAGSRRSSESEAWQIAVINITTLEISLVPSLVPHVVGLCPIWVPAPQ